MAKPRIALPEEDARDLHEAWSKRESLPADIDRAKYEAAVRSVYADLMQQYDPPHEENATLKALGAGALDVANYGTGLVQTPVMQAALALGGGEEGRKKVGEHFVQDWKDTLNPLDATPAPSVGEWMDRGNVPHGPKVLPEILREQMAAPETPGLWPPERDGLLDPDVRGIVELPAAMAISPAGVGSAIEGGKRALGKTEAQLMAKRTAPQAAAVIRGNAMLEARKTTLQKLRDKIPMLLDPMGEGSKRVGKSIYASVFDSADEASRKAGQGAVSDVMRKEGAWGTAGQLRDRAAALADDKGAEVTGLVKEVQRVAPIMQASRYDVRQPVTQMLFDMEGKSGFTEAAQKANAKIGQEFNAAHGPLKRNFSITELDDIKKSYQNRARKMGAYNSAPQSGMSATRAVDNSVNAQVLGDAYKMQGQRARRELEDILDDLEPGLGGQTYLKNRDIATLLAGEKELTKTAATPLAQRARAGMMGTGLGGAAGVGLSYATGNPWMIPLLAGMGLGASSDLARTGVGLGLAKYGKKAGNLGRAALVESQGEKARKRSPWRLMTQEMEN